MPNTFSDQEITEADIVGDLRVVWRNSDGEQTGVGVAEPGALRTGLIGPHYERLEVLARSMAKVRPVQVDREPRVSAHSALRLGTGMLSRNQGSAEVRGLRLLRSLERAMSEHRLLFPVSALHVQSPLTLGSVTVSTFPESIFEAL